MIGLHLSLFKLGLFFCRTREEFRYLTKNVVLATGSYDRPNILSVPGESLPFVFHSLKDFETLLASKQFGQSSDPVGLKLNCVTFLVTRPNSSSVNFFQCGIYVTSFVFYVT